ncbi:hypothetical protein HY095_03810 [Candidatus Micrarchaeota archaeon]|nr:hypothetical protein [Candidatus Micrarchaeota archaeon]
MARKKRVSRRQNKSGSFRQSHWDARTAVGLVASFAAIALVLYSLYSTLLLDISPTVGAPAPGTSGGEVQASATPGESPFNPAVITSRVQVVAPTYSKYNPAVVKSQVQIIGTDSNRINSQVQVVSPSAGPSQ